MGVIDELGSVDTKFEDGVELGVIDVDAGEHTRLVTKVQRFN